MTGRVQQPRKYSLSTDKKTGQHMDQLLLLVMSICIPKSVLETRKDKIELFVHSIDFSGNNNEDETRRACHK